MSEDNAPWRIGIVGSENIPMLNRYIYARLKELRSDWPKATFEVIASTTGQAGRAAVSSARRLGMSFSGVKTGVYVKSERLIGWTTFEADEVWDEIGRALQLRRHVEVYDHTNEPAGARVGDAFNV